MKNTRGELVTDEKIREAWWSSYFEKLLNEEFEWNRDFLKDWQVRWELNCGVSRVNNARQEVKLAIKSDEERQSSWSIGGHSRNVASGWRSRNKMGDGDHVMPYWRREKFRIDWERSWIVSVYKGKGDALECGSYRGIKLAGSGNEGRLERVIEKRIRSRVQLRWNAVWIQTRNCGTTDAISAIVRQLQEKYSWKEERVCGWRSLI